MPFGGITTAIVGVFGLNFVLGLGLVYGVFWLMEENPVAGLAGGGLVGIGIIFAESTLGEWLFEPTVSEMKFLVVAATAGGLLGVIVTMMVFEPDLDPE